MKGSEGVEEREREREGEREGDRSRERDLAVVCVLGAESLLAASLFMVLMNGVEWGEG